MAKAPAKQEEPVAHKAPRKKWLLIIVVVLVVVLALGGGGVWWLRMRQSNAAIEGSASKGVAASNRSDAVPVFVRLEPFTVKLQSDPERSEQYLQMVPELRVLDASIGEKVKLYMPEIRNRILLLLSSKKPSDLSTPQGMEALSAELRSQINQIIDGSPQGAVPAAAKARPDDPVQSVLYTSFIIQ
ncbi:flagellar basal body-associated protein FliL [mine drainage metagenome]|uniref:Flagellar basal body-associated protein FliL n=1 Tax=mine drainage metagenome TaxID=410659 RepID=A0A1J5RV37_9ZZZZ